MDGNVLEMDGNVLEMVCPRLLCIGIEEGVWGCGSFLSSRVRCVWASPARHPLAGDTRWTPQLAEAEALPPWRSY